MHVCRRLSVERVSSVGSKGHYFISDFNQGDHPERGLHTIQEKPARSG